MSDDIRAAPVPSAARTDFAGAQTAGNWGEILRAEESFSAGARDADRCPLERSGGGDLTRLRSAAVFGNRFTADVVICVNWLSSAGDGRVTVRKVAADTGLSDSVVSPVLRRLCAGGLLTAIPRAGGAGSALHYQVCRNELWAGVLSVCVALAGMEDTAATRP